MNLVTGGLIEIEDYNEIALEVNRLFSDNTVGLVWSTSDLVLNQTVTGTPLLAGTNLTFDVVDLNLDETQFVAVIVDDGSGWRTLQVDTDYTIGYGPNPEVIKFKANYEVGTQFKIYHRDPHLFGWGQQASVYPVDVGDPVLADEATLQAYLEANVNNLIDKVNIMEDRIGGPSELTRVNPGQLIYASDKTTITSTINTDIVSGNNYWQNELSTIQGNLFTFNRTTPWTTELTAATRWSWDSYNDFRYFFNSGCDLRATLLTSGDRNNQGFLNWTNVINTMGTLVLNYDTCSQTGSNGISENIGAYQLTEDYQTVFTSTSPNLPVGTDPTEYEEYVDYTDLVIVWQARVVENAPAAGNISIDIRCVLDDSSYVQTFDGTIEYQSGYRSANDVTDNSAVFSITDYLPDITQQQDFVASGTTPAPATVLAQHSTAGFSDNQNVGIEYIIDTGDVIMRVDPEVLGNGGSARYDSSTTTYVAGGESFNTNGTLKLQGLAGTTGDTMIVKLTWEPKPGSSVRSDVNNVSFRISDIDGSSPVEDVTINAYDADNNLLDITYTTGLNISVTDNVISSGSVNGTPDSSAHSVLIEIAGPVARVEYVYANRASSDHSIYMSDVQFDIIPIAN